MPELNSPFLHFEWHPVTSTYTLESSAGSPASKINATLSVHFHQNGRSCFIQDWSTAEITTPEKIDSRQGPLQQISLTGTTAGYEIDYMVDFALAENQPLFLCTVTLKNTGTHPLAIERIVLCQAGPGSIDFGSGKDRELAFFSNGWQSWSYSGTYGSGDSQFRSHLGPFRQPLLDNPGTPRPGRSGHYGSDFFGVLGDRTQLTGLLAGFLSQKQQFGSLEVWTRPEPALSLWANGDSTRLDPGATLETDQVVLSFLDLNQPDPLGPYLEAVARQHDLRPASPSTTGWCSWYYYYNHLSGADIQRNLQASLSQQESLPLCLIQIDDGFETKIGDWSSFTPAFPGGVAPLANEIRHAGLVPGLWLAPFLVNPKSHLAHVHPDFLLRNYLRLPVISGATSEAFINTALDLSYPPALEYACQVVRTAACDWGFPYLKLDFLSAGALAGQRHDRTRSRAQILRHALEALRQAVGPEIYLAGCGAPLGSSIGIFDSMRIGEDVSPAWEPEVPILPGLFRQEAEFPSVRNAIHNILTRAPLHQRWWTNDPDCLLVRPDSHATLAEVQALATAISLSGGTYLLSDDLSRLSTDRLDLASYLLPPIGKRPWVLDWFDAANPSRIRLDLEGLTGPWYLLAFFNWKNEVVSPVLHLADYGLPAAVDYWVRSFWEQKTSLVKDRAYPVKNLPPHGIILLAVRPVHSGEPQYLGSSLHISQGIEVASWQATSKDLHLRLELPRSAHGQIELSLPFTPQKVVSPGLTGPIPLPWAPSGEGCCLIDVSFQNSITLDIG